MPLQLNRNVNLLPTEVDAKHLSDMYDNKNNINNNTGNLYFR